ncbi:MAG: signal peptide peptidase SppA [Cyanobacteria bacterium P01_H01_bin.15]
MGQFLRQTLASLLGTLLALSLMVAIGAGSLVLVLIAASLSGDSEPDIKDKSVLVIDLSLPISDAPSQLPLANRLASSNPTSLPLRKVLTALEAAAEDDRIVGVFLDGRSGDALNGYATLTEIREALLKVQAQEKKIIAYDVDWGERGYFLGSTGDTIYVNPMGTVNLDGFGSEQLFFADALNNLGVGVQIIRVGNYKSAVEPFVRSDFSAESREQTAELLNALWLDFRTQITEAQSAITPAKIQAMADTKGFVQAEEAKSEQLVDRVAYFDEVLTDLLQLTEVEDPQDGFTQVSIADYISQLPVAESYDSKIAVVYAEGSIVGGEGGPTQIGGDHYAKVLREVRLDDDIKALVLRVNSPGGSATASEIIWREIDLISRDKPVVISMGDVAASGGYWLATAGQHIFAQPSTITGSIGVFGLLPNIEALGQNNGFTWDRVTTSKFADTGSITRPKTPAELARYQTFVDETYDLFLKKVAQARDLSIEQVNAIAQGRVWSGEGALANGLIDELGGLQAAIDYAAEAAELGEKFELVEYPGDRGLRELLEEFFQARKFSLDLGPFNASLEQWRDELGVLEHLDDPRSVYLRLPYEPNIE